MVGFGRDAALDGISAKALREQQPGLRRFADLIRDRMAPAELWVFGSRARGDERPDSDWDLLVLFEDETAVGDDLTLWRLSREAGLVADVVGTTTGDAMAARDVATTLMYSASREAVRVA